MNFCFFNNAFVTEIEIISVFYCTMGTHGRVDVVVIFIILAYVFVGSYCMKYNIYV